jgi:hypothetical protein
MTTTQTVLDQEEDMSNRIRALTVAAAALTLAAALGTAVSLAQDSALPLKGEPMRGTWGFSASGTIVPPAVPAATPAAAVGLMTFQPTGNCVIEDTINIGGASLSRASNSCTYSLVNGRGSINVTFPDDPVPVPLSFVLVDHDREMRFIRTDLGVAEGVAKLQ